MIEQYQYYMMLARIPVEFKLRHILLIDSFHELPNHQRYALYSLDLLLCSYKLSL